MERLIIYRCGDRKLNCPACPKCGDCSGNADCVEVLMEQRAAYEDSGLAPEDIPTGLELANVFCALNELKKYEALGTLDELKALQEKSQSRQGCQYCQDSDCLEAYLEMGDRYCRHCGRKLNGGNHGLGT